MNAQQIALTNAKADVAMIRRMELRDAALEVWAERDEIIDSAIKRNVWVDGLRETCEELAKTAEYVEWLVGQLYQSGWRRAPRWQIDAIYADADAADLIDTQRSAVW